KGKGGASRRGDASGLVSLWRTPVARRTGARRNTLAAPLRVIRGERKGGAPALTTIVSASEPVEHDQGLSFGSGTVKSAVPAFGNATRNSGHTASVHGRYTGDPAGSERGGTVLRTPRLILIPLTELDEDEHARASRDAADASRDTRAAEVQWREHRF